METTYYKKAYHNHTCQGTACHQTVYHKYAGHKNAHNGREAYSRFCYLLGCLLTRHTKLALYGTVIMIAVAALSAVLWLSGPEVVAQADHINQKYYTCIQVNSGDTLWDIAQEYKTSEYASTKAYVEEIKEINHLSDDVITSGCYLMIPYYAVHPNEEK